MAELGDIGRVALKGMSTFRGGEAPVLAFLTGAEAIFASVLPDLVNRLPRLRDRVSWAAEDEGGNELSKTSGGLPDPVVGRPS